MSSSFSIHLSKVRGPLLDWKLSVKSVDILEVVILEHADLHGVVLLPPLGILLDFLLVSLTFDPLTPFQLTLHQAVLTMNQNITPPSPALS